MYRNDRALLESIRTAHQIITVVVTAVITVAITIIITIWIPTARLADHRMMSDQ